MSDRVRHIVIVGGGAAGWLTAGVLAAEHGAGQGEAVGITLVESPDVRTIGVGEGTWPTMRDTLRRMGVSESAFIKNCNVSFKQASRFAGWVTGVEDDFYYHPFTAPAGFGEVNLLPSWMQAADGRSFADAVCFQPELCEAGLAPKQKSTPEFAAVANYAYHLDAGRFGQFLQEHCTGVLGVRHVLAHVEGIRARENGDIAGLETPEKGLIEGDLFIDCTGFSSLLLGRHYGVPLVGIGDKLFCDNAIAAQIPYMSDDQPIASSTLATAQGAGWIWDIGLPTRRGAGYVYSSSHTSHEQAERDLRAYLRAANPDFEPELRRIPLNPGHRETFWHRNCVAVGIAAGFIEPLEASALALIELSARMIAEELPPNRALMNVVAGRFNDRFRYRWSRIVDFLKLHYLLSQRSDTDFWVDNRRKESVPERLQELLELWRYRPPSRWDFTDSEEIFPAASYQYVLYGMGFRPESNAHPRRGDDPRAATHYLGTVEQLKRKYMAGLPSNRELVRHVNERGLPRV